MADPPYPTSGKHSGRDRFRHVNSIPHFALGQPGKRGEGDCGDGLGGHIS